jgi:cobalt/nickel transport system permease protein
MVGSHLLVAGVVELVLTAGVVTYLQRANVPILRINHAAVPETDADVLVPEPRLRLRGLLIGLGAMVVLVPLGLFAPGSAFGEDGPQDLDLAKYGLRAVPTGLQRYSDFWSHAFFPGYDTRDGAHPNAGYYVSAVVGTALIAGVVLLTFRTATRIRRRRADRVPPAAAIREPANS